jgi:MOSC domain-containing protein YiiM
MTGRIVQINISKGGVPKRPVAEAVVTPLGIEGDAVAHPSIHGGPRQALLLLAGEAIEEMKRLGYPLFYGALGENLTTRGIDHRRFREGQRYRAGEVILELTRPRSPCGSLDGYGQGIREAIYDVSVKAGDPASPRWGMSGFYASVIQPGVIRTGDPILLLDEMA